MIILPTPPFDQYLRFLQIHEYLPLQQFVLQLPVKRLVVPVLPGTARFDVERLHFQVHKPAPYHLRHEFRAAV